MAAVTASPSAEQTPAPAPVPAVVPAAEATAVTDGAAASTDGAAEAEGEGYNFDEDTFVGARDLAAKLDANPQLVAALPEDLRNEIMANARLAEQLAPYRGIFGSPEEAKLVAQTAQEFSGIQQIFSSIGEDVGKGTTSLLNKMLEMSALRDDEGNPRKRPDGSFITDGTTTKFLNELFDRKFNASIVKKIQDSGNEAAIAALDVVMESAGLRTSTADQGQIEPELAARKAQLDAQQAEITRQTQAQKQEQVKNFTTARDSELQSLTTAEFDKLLAPATGLNDLTRSAVVAKLTKAVRDAVNANTSYMIEKRQLESQPMTPQRKGKEIALAARFFRNHLARIAAPVLAEAGISTSTRQASRAEAQAAREKAARGDVNGSAPATTAKAGDTRDAVQSRQPFIDAFKSQNGGREPSDSEVNQAMMLAAWNTRRSAA